MPPDGDFCYNPAIPEPIRDIFAQLGQDVAWLHYKWNSYLELFAKPENAALLSDMVRALFQLMEESLRNDMTMAIARLNDPPRSMGKENCSIATLVERLAGHPVHPRLQVLLREFKAACEPIEKHRNKRVGHNDLATAIKPHEHPLPGVGRSQVDTILGLAAKILRTTVDQFDSIEYGFDRMIKIGGADDLMFWLRKGWEARDRD
jgi:hypothetical protein